MLLLTATSAQRMCLVVALAKGRGTLRCWRGRSVDHSTHFSHGYFCHKRTHRESEYLIEVLLVHVNQQWRSNTLTSTEVVVVVVSFLCCAKGSSPRSSRSCAEPQGRNPFSPTRLNRRLSSVPSPQIYIRARS